MNTINAHKRHLVSWSVRTYAWESPRAARPTRAHYFKERPPRRRTVAP